MSVPRRVDGFEGDDALEMGLNWEATKKIQDAFY